MVRSQRLWRSHPLAALFASMVVVAPLTAQQTRLAPDGVTLLSAAPSPSGTPMAAASSGPACVDIIYFDENGTGGVGRGLYDFLSSTGTSSLRVNVPGSERIFSLASDPSGLVYGVDPLADKVYFVDLAGGTLTFLFDLIGTSTVADLAIDPITGQLYGAERNAPLNLYTIDISTGQATTVGTMSSVRTGLTFGPDGTLYGCSLNGTLYQIDPATAAETLVGGGSGPGLLEDATVRPDGMIFVTDWNGGLYSIDPATGTNTLLGNSGLGSGCLGITREPTAVVAAEVVRAGTPANPTALLPGVTSGPLIGATWDPIIDHSTFFPGAVIDFVALSFTSVNVPSPFGTALCNPDVLFAGVPGNSFQLPIPANCMLGGVTFCIQGGATDGVSIQVTNALDVVVGSF